MKFEKDRIILTDEEAEYLKTGDYSLIDPFNFLDKKIKIEKGRIILPATNSVEKKIEVTEDGFVCVSRWDIQGRENE